MEKSNKKIKPFFYSAIISGAAMALLYFYFDWFYTTQIGGWTIYPPLGAIPAQEYDSSIWSNLHWTLLFAVIPPIAFFYALNRFNKATWANRKKYWVTGAAVTMCWLILFLVYVDLNQEVGFGGEINGNGEYLVNYTSSGPYLTYILALPFVCFAGSYLLYHFLQKGQFIPKGQVSPIVFCLAFLITPGVFAALFHFQLNELPPQESILNNLRGTDFQVFLSAAFVTSWQLVFAWLIFRKKNNSSFLGKIEAIGKP